MGDFCKHIPLSIYRVQRRGIKQLLVVKSILSVLEPGALLILITVRQFMFIQRTTVSGPSGKTWNCSRWQGKLVDLVCLHVAPVPLDLRTDLDLSFMKTIPGECRVCPCARTRLFSAFIHPVLWPLKRNRPHGLQSISHILSRVPKNVHVIIFEILHHRIQSLLNKYFHTFYMVLNDESGIMSVFKTLSSQLYCRKIRNGTRPLCSFLENTRSIQPADAILTEEGYGAESWGGYKSPSSAAFYPPSTHFPIRLIPPRPSSAASEAVGQTTTPTLEL